MPLARREFVKFATAAATASFSFRPALALDYPTHPVRLIVGLPPGLTPDIAARLSAELLSQRLGQQFIVDNRPGANASIAAGDVVRAPPDGYTLLLVVAGYAVDATLRQNAGYNFVRDIVPVAVIGRTPFVMAVNPSVPAKTVPELIAYAKANPGKLNFASPGTGGVNHVFAELFKMMTGVDMVHVPYRTSFMPDLLAGQVQLVFTAVSSALSNIRAGQLRALAVTTVKRVDVLPDVPAMDEVVPGYEGSGWVGLGAPRGTPADIIDKLNAETNAALSAPDGRARLLALGIEPASMSPADFGKLITADVAKWAKVIKFADIKPD